MIAKPHSGHCGFSSTMSSWRSLSWDSMVRPWPTVPRCCPRLRQLAALERLSLGLACSLLVEKRRFCRSRTCASAKSNLDCNAALDFRACALSARTRRSWRTTCCSYLVTALRCSPCHCVAAILNSMCSCLVIVMKTWANGGGGVSATALMAAVSGRAEVARTGATVKQKNDRVQRFLQRLYGFTE